MTSGPGVISCLHLPPASSQPAALSNHTHLSLLCLFSTWLFSLLSPPKQFLAFLPMDWLLLGRLLCGQWMNHTISSFIGPQQTVASPHFLPGFLGQLSVPEATILNARPGAGQHSCSADASSTPSSKATPFSCLHFGSRAYFC